MTTYEDSLTLLDARRRYMDTHGFDATYRERWVKLKAGPVSIYFPNAEGRRRAVRFHDLHHIATGYQTTWTGEAEISAWEIASNCGGFMWAWFLNLQGMAIGLLIAPRAVFRAFVRGRHTRNLYHQGEFREGLLQRSVGDVRRSLGLDRPAPRPRLSDVLTFAAWAVGTVALQAWPLLLIAWWLSG